MKSLAEAAAAETAAATSQVGTAADAVAVELSVVSPKRGRLLIFPRVCPHSGKPTISTPKRFLRGELVLVCGDDDVNEVKDDDHADDAQ